MRKFLIFLSGARPDILEQIPSERTAFEARGAVVLASGVIFSVATAGLLFAEANVNWVLAVVAGVAVGFAVCVIERFPAPKPTSWGERLLSLAPRVLFATLLGALLAQLALIVIFRPQIDEQIVLMHIQQERNFAVTQASSPLSKDISALQNQVNSLQKVIATGGATKLSAKNDPTLATLQHEIAQLNSREAADFTKWQCELYGVSPGGSKCAPAGAGALAQADQAAYESDVAEVRNLQQQLANRTAQLSANDAAASQARVAVAEQQLPGVRAELEHDLAERQSQTATFSAANHAEAGLLAHIDALNEVSGSHGAVRASTILLTLLFIMLAAIPALIGVLLPSRSYERTLASVDRLEAMRLQYRLRSAGEAALLPEALDREAPQPAPSPPARADVEGADQALRAMRDIRREGGD